MLLDDQPEELRLAHGGLHHGARLLLALGHIAGLIEFSGEGVEGHLDLLGAPRLQLGHAILNALLCFKRGSVAPVGLEPCQCICLVSRLALRQVLGEALVAGIGKD